MGATPARCGPLRHWRPFSAGAGGLLSGPFSR